MTEDEQRIADYEAARAYVLAQEKAARRREDRLAKKAKRQAEQRAYEAKKEAKTAFAALMAAAEKEGMLRPPSKIANKLAFLTVVKDRQDHLREKAYARWGSHCPCCNARMHKPNGIECRNGGHNAARTAGHDIPRSMGGPWQRWIYICLRCNREQANLSFADWAKVLERAADPRYVRVAAVAQFFLEEAGPWPTTRS